MTQSYMPSFTDREALTKWQLEGLKWTIKHAYDGSLFYRQRMEEAGVRPEAIKSLEDLQQLPFTQAEDLKQGYPYPLLSVPLSKVVRIHASSGTTGKKKVLCYTQKDIDDWVHMFARCYEMAGLTKDDRIQIAVGYGIWTAGAGFQLGCEKFGAMAIPVGPGNIDLQCRFLMDMKSTVMCCTASMALLMAEEVERRGIKDKIALKKIIFGSERSSDAMRERIKYLLGLEAMYDIPGMTELYGPGTGLDCHHHEGIHYWADYYILEILDPETLLPVKEGEVGEMVVTTLKKEAAPLVRYRTHDLTRVILTPCACGSVLPRHDRILGRTDDMIIFRAVNIYPGQVDEVLSSVPALSSEYQIILDADDNGKDYMTVRVEAAKETSEDERMGLSDRVSQEIKNQMMVSCKVEVVAYAGLPRSERKSKRVYDHRNR